MTAAIRWGILGTGAIARRFLADFPLVSGASFAAIGSRNADTARAFADEFGAARAHGSYDALIADPDVDVVYIATPNTQHADQAIAALEAGKAVLCEKPFTMTATEARDVAEVARRTGRFCMEAMWMRFAPTVRELQRRINDGEIGEVQHITASLGFANAFDPANRLFDAALGGGALLDLGVYPISFCHAVLGAPSALVAWAEFFPTGVDGHASITLKYASGATASIETSLLTSLSNNAVVTGTKGAFVVEAPLYFPHVLTAGSKAAHAWVAAPPGGTGFEYEAREVVRCVGEGLGESAIMPLDESIRVMDTMDAVRAAWST